MNKNQTNAVITLLSAVLLGIIILIVMYAKNGSPRSEEVLPAAEHEHTEEMVDGDAKTANESLVQEDGLIHPKAPGDWMYSAVKNITPETFVTGENILNANVRGLFVEGVGMVKVYDNLTEIFSTEMEPAGEEDGAAVHTAIKPVTITIPENMKGKTVIVRFIKPGVEAAYWGTTIEVK